MVIQHNRYLEIWLKHVRYLSVDIGPRGSTTDEERQASDYCQQTLSGLGLKAQFETFIGARSIYHPHLLGALSMFFAFIIYPLAGRVSAGAAALLSLVSVISTLMELSFRDNKFRRLTPKGSSQNVVAIIPPLGKRQRDIVLIGHVDSHRTPIIFSTQRWVIIYQTFTTIVFILSLAQVILYSLGIFTQWQWIWPVSILSAICAVLLAAMCIQADRTPISAGANDNATGAGLVLSLGAHLSHQPLQNTQVWLVCSGCEEVQHYGAIDFFQRHHADLHRATAIVFEALGCAGPAWLEKEGIVIPFHADKNLVILAKRLSAEHGEWGVYPVEIKGGNTEMSDALQAGIPAITLGGVGPQGEIPFWHQVEDTYDKMDPEVMARAYKFTWAFIQSLDEQVTLS